MKNKLKTILLLIFCFVSSIAIAQEKYALLVGIDKYYEKPGVVSYHSLKGCVNDANSIKALLLNRFGYKPENIKTLYDGDASKKNVVAALMSMANNCKAGDAFVFYYSGHGVWAWDLDNADDPVKRGMNQAMVMSDLYSENLSCLLTDAMIKKLFNRFIDKKAVLTSIFDCCYSGSLPMDIMQFGHNVYYPWLMIDAEEKSFPLSDIPFTQDGKTLDNEFGNFGVPYNFDFRVYNELFGADDITRRNAIVDSLNFILQHSTDSTALAHVENTLNGFELINNHLSNHENDTAEFVRNFDYTDAVKAFGLLQPDDSLASTRSYNLKDAIKIFDPENVPRPSERTNSKFLSLSATTDVEKGLEITDQNGNYHGAFTNALLSVYKTNPADISMTQLTKKITEEMVKQRYQQSPTFHYEQSRLSGNLLGISPAGFSNTISAKCNSVKGNLVSLDIGSTAGITKGNYFKNINNSEDIIMQVDSVSPFNSFGKIIKGNPVKLKSGNSFILTSTYTKTTPYIKIYIASAPFTKTSFTDFFTKKIQPLTTSVYYSDLGNFDNSLQQNTYNIFYRDALHVNSEELTKISNPGNSNPFFIFLPVPSYISNSIKNVLKKNLNIELVNSAAKANYVLCFNYIKYINGAEDNSHFVLTLQNFFLSPVYPFGYAVYPWMTDLKNTDLNTNDLNKLANNINDMVNTAARTVAGKKWLN